MCLSSAGYSSCLVALTMATSRSETELLLPTLARLMLVWSFTCPMALLSLLGAMGNSVFLPATTILALNSYELYEMNAEIERE